MYKMNVSEKIVLFFLNIYSKIFLIKEWEPAPRSHRQKSIMQTSLRKQQYQKKLTPISNSATIKLHPRPKKELTQITMYRRLEFNNFDLKQVC